MNRSPRGDRREPERETGLTPHAKKPHIADEVGEKRPAEQRSPGPAEKTGRMVAAVLNLIEAIEPNEEPDPMDGVPVPDVEPTEYEELEAKMAEIERLVGYDAFELVWPNPEDKMLTLKWVREIRSGAVKMRLCARPFGREMVRSKDELFTPTPCIMSLRALLVHAHRQGLSVRFFDDSRAFLHTPIRDRVLVWPPAEFDAEEGQAWLLNCVLYGLNEGMCDFDSHFENVVTGAIEDEARPKLALKRSVADSACYYDLPSRLSLLKHVDDGMVVAGETENDKFIEDLGACFLLKPSGFMKESSAQKFLGRWFERVPIGISDVVRRSLVEELVGPVGP